MYWTIGRSITRSLNHPISRYRDLPRGCPLRPALQGHDEILRAHGDDVMTFGGVEHAALAVCDRHENRFVAMGLLRVCRGQNGHLLPRPAQARVELVCVVHPF